MFGKADLDGMTSMRQSRYIVETRCTAGQREYGKGTTPFWQILFIKHDSGSA